MRKCSQGLRNQLNHLYEDMNISQGAATSMYYDLRTKLNEMLTNQISSNLSVGSRCNSRSSSKRSYKDFQSGCKIHDNIIYMLNGILGKLHDENAMLHEENAKLNQDNNIYIVDNVVI